MKAVVLTNEDFEDITEEEIKKLVPATKTEIRRAAVLFEGEKQDLMRVAYRAQSIKKVMIYLCDFGFSSLEELGSKSNIDFSAHLDPDTSFAVRAEKVDSQFSSQDIERAVAKNVPAKADLDSPDVIVGCIIIGGHCYIGIDLSGIDLSKRYYKIFSHPRSLKGTLAYFLLKRAGYTKTKTLLDPFAGSGIIPIEAAYIDSGDPINFYRKGELKFASMKSFKTELDGFFEQEDKSKDKPPSSPKIFAYDHQLPAVNSVKKNAKIAGLSKFVFQGRGEVDWIDTKFEKNSIDLIVTDPPKFSKLNLKKNTKLYEQFFHRIKPILKDSAKVLVISNSEDAKKIAEKKGFASEKEWKFKIGKSTHHIFRFVKIKA